MKPIQKPATKVLYVTLKAINAAIVAAKAQGTSYQAELDKIALSALAHMGKHKDVRVVNAFIESVVDSVRVNALRSWFETFGSMKYDVEAKAMIYDKSKQTRLGEAMGNPFWKFKTEEAYIPMDVKAAVANLLTRLVKDGTNTKRDHSRVIKALEGVL
jgi:hypothetical protein